jgi:hypothetical protein
MPNPPLSGLTNPHRYAAEGDVVLDEITGLMWQRIIDSGPGDGGGFVWPAARAHCEELSLAGFSDWRLPTRIELVSLVDFTRAEPAIDVEAFPATPTAWTWSQSPAKEPSNFIWYVNFFYGYTNSNDPVYSQQVRCVRRAGSASAAEGASPTFVYEIGAETVRDVQRGLTWQRRVPTDSFSADDASAYCAGLELDGERGFRLPSMKELQTIVLEEHADPAIDTQVFPDTPSEQFWTSSRLAVDAEQAWFVLFYDGYALYTDANTPYRVRCVR